MEITLILIHITLATIFLGVMVGFIFFKMNYHESICIRYYKSCDCSFLFKLWARFIRFLMFLWVKKEINKNGG
jgi:hypothetical protein